jgi:hypothetical protein
MIRHDITPKRVVTNAMMLMLGMLLASIFHPLDYMSGWAQQAGCQTFPETGKSVCGRFLQYWQTHGGLAQQGYPISAPFSEASDLDGKPYTVQYFERAVFELHPENPYPNDVLLSQLGTFQFKRKYPDGNTSGGGSASQPIVGQIFEITGANGMPLRYTVLSVRETTEIFEYHARGKYVVLFVTTTNLGTATNDIVRPSAIRLLDDQGRRYELAIDGVHRAGHDKYYRDSPFAVGVGPKASDEQLLIFETAPDATNYKMIPAQVPNP